MSAIEEIVKLKNYISDFCKKYSQEKGDCYNCPIGKRIREYCKVDGIIRFLDEIINIEYFYVYILETVSKKNKISYYTGYSNNLERRLAEHRKGTGAKFCRGKKSIELKYYESFLSIRDAMRRELEIKSFSKQKKRELVNGININ